MRLNNENDSISGGDTTNDEQYLGEKNKWNKREL